MTNPHNNRRWWGWGSLDEHYDDHAAMRFIEVVSTLLDRIPTPKPALSEDELVVPTSRLPPAFSAAWTHKGLSLDRHERIVHAVGKSYRDLLRIRSGQVKQYPDGVLFLRTASDLPQLFQDARTHRIALIPFGGGTNVVGATECLTGSHHASLIVNLTRLSQLLELNETAQTATFEAGILGPDLEAQLNAQGYTLGHFPQSFEFSTLGGWAVTRSAGQNSTKYGKIEKIIAALKLITPTGELVLPHFPASAAGPSLQEFVVGSEGLYGFVTEVTVKIHRIPEKERFISAFFSDFDTGSRAIAHLIQADLRPSIVRLSDASETALLLDLQFATGLQKTILEKWLTWKGLGHAPCLLIMGVEGKAHDVTAQYPKLLQTVRAHGGIPIPKNLGKKWKTSRFRAPYLRDDLMDAGFFIDTLETATTWTHFTDLHRAMNRAFSEYTRRTGETVIIGCHLSHAYRDGASLYFTLLASQRDNQELAQWEEIKTLATDTLIAAGGTLSHHHGIGLDHRPWMTIEKTALGINMLRAVKTELDPDGLLNPGKLF